MVKRIIFSLMLIASLSLQAMERNSSMSSSTFISTRPGLSALIQSRAREITIDGKRIVYPDPNDQEIFFKADIFAELQKKALQRLETLELFEGDSTYFVKYLITCIAFNQGGTTCAAGCSNGKVIIFELESGNILHIIEHPDTVNSVVFFRNDRGSQLLTGCQDDKARVIGVRSGRIAKTINLS